MNCPRCGTLNPEGATQCRECGAPLPAQPRYTSPARTTSGTALASLICGLLGWSFLPLVGSVLAIVLGHMAKSEIKASGGTLGGDMLATLGLILGYSSVGLAVVGTLIGIIAALFFGIVLPFGVLGCGLCAGFGA